MNLIGKTNENFLSLAPVSKFPKGIRAPKIGIEKAAVLFRQLTC